MHRYNFNDLYDMSVVRFWKINGELDNLLNIDKTLTGITIQSCIHLAKYLKSYLNIQNNSWTHYKYR